MSGEAPLLDMCLRSMLIALSALALAVGALVKVHTVDSRGPKFMRDARTRRRGD
jgi:hypothetical protein